MSEPSDRARESDGTPTVEIDDVSKYYGGRAALQSVTLSMGNEFFSLLGPSGSGKTTLLRIIGGFVGVDTGRVRIAGRDVADTPPYRRPCNTVFQHYALFPHLSVADNIGFGLREHKVPRAESRRRVGEALDMVQMAGAENRRPQELSGGQQQRVALARALVNRPQVLLLDEPLAALDAQLRKTMQLELKTLQQDVGITFIYVTHDQEEALVMSDRIAVLDGGRVIQVGDPQFIYDKPTSQFVAKFIGQSNLLPVHAVVAANHDGSLVKLPSGTVVPAAAGIPTGPARGQLMVRPEDVCLSVGSEGDPVAGALRGRIVSETYLGSSLRVEVAVEAANIVASLPKDSSARLPVGAEVSVSWRAAAARFIPDDPEGP